MAVTTLRPSKSCSKVVHDLGDLAEKDAQPSKEESLSKALL